MFGGLKEATLRRLISLSTGNNPAIIRCQRAEPRPLKRGFACWWRHRLDSAPRPPCKMGLEGIVSMRLGSRYVLGRSRDWLKMKNPNAPAVRREAEEG